jgi:hypothetical protein
MQTLFGRPGGDESEHPAIPPWMQPPQDEYPVQIPVREFFGRTDGTVLSVSHLEVFTTGVVVRAESALRRTTESPRDWSWVLHGGTGRVRDESGDELHWGVVLGDGSTTTLGRSFSAQRRWDEPPQGWSLTFASGGGGGGGDDWYEQHHGLWLWPLPPRGPMEIVAEWRERGIPETRIVLDGNKILAAVPNVRPLWP